ncbi:MAG: hypothetical protein ACP5UH_01290 [Candidatus Micrarchaeia archaeon]
MRFMLHDAIKDRWFLGTSIFIALLIIFLAAAIAWPGIFRHAGAARIGSASAPTTTTSQSQYNVVLKNLSYESYYFKNGKLYQNVPIEIVNNITINPSSNTVTVGSILNLSIIYTGTFNFNLYDTTPFIKNTVDIQYFGYYENGSENMLVYNNRPNATEYFISNATPKAFQPPGMAQNGALGMLVSITPTAAAAGKTWLFCGGFFEAFSNNTGWIGIFNNVTYAKVQISNDIVINRISGRCAEVKVYA